MDILTNPFIFLSDKNKTLQKVRMQESPRDFQLLYLAGGVGNTWQNFPSWLKQVHIYMPHCGKPHIWILGWHR